MIGLGLPNDNKRYVHEGITDCIVLWNTIDLGYLTVLASHALAEGTLKAGDREIQAGRLGDPRDRGGQHPARQAVHVHEGEYRPVRLLTGPSVTGRRARSRVLVGPTSSDNSNIEIFVRLKSDLPVARGRSHSRVLVEVKEERRS